MHVLVTGMTPMQSGKGNRAQVVETGRIFANALAEAGHSVEMRTTTPGESLRDFDAVIVGVTKPTSLSANHLFTALDVIGRAIAEGCRLGFYVDDFSVENIPAQVRYVVEKGPDSMFKFSRPHMEWARANADQLMLVLRALQDYPWPPTLAPAFPWGRHEMLVEAGGFNGASQFVFVDPSSGTPPLDVAIPGVRERSWVLPSLSKITDANNNRIARRGLKWPIERYGPKGYKRLTEPEIVQRYANARGVLAQPYKQVGSGWWRVRFIHAVWARSVLVAVDEREVSALGDAYLQQPAVIEAMTDAELDALADAQAIELRGRAWSREQFVGALNEYVATLPNAVVSHA